MQLLNYPLPEPIPPAPPGWSKTTRLRLEQDIPPQPHWLINLPWHDIWTTGILVLLGSIVYGICAGLYLAVLHEHYNLSPRRQALLALLWPLCVPLHLVYRAGQAILFNH